MRKSVQYPLLVILMTVTSAVSFRAGVRAQDTIEGSVFRSSAGGSSLEVLFDGSNRGVPADVGILTFPAGTNSGDHQHEQTEIFFVLDGVLEHVVNGESTRLGPGSLGHVTPPDFVNHITDTNGSGARALVIWSPAGGAASIASRWPRVVGPRDGDREP